MTKKKNTSDGVLFRSVQINCINLLRIVRHTFTSEVQKDLLFF